MSKYEPLWGHLRADGRDQRGNQELAANERVSLRVILLDKRASAESRMPLDKPNWWDWKD
jgi:hypothetical protein